MAGCAGQQGLCSRSRLLTLRATAAHLPSAARHTCMGNVSKTVLHRFGHLPSQKSASILPSALAGSGAVVWAHPPGSSVGGGGRRGGGGGGPGSGGGGGDNGGSSGRTRHYWLQFAAAAVLTLYQPPHAAAAAATREHQRRRRRGCAAASPPPADNSTDWLFVPGLDADALAARLAEASWPLLSSAGFSGLMGAAAAAALKWAGRTLAAAFGAALVLVQLMSHQGLVTVHWSAVHEKTRGILDSKGTGQLDQDALRATARRGLVVLTEGIPSASGFLLGFVVGLRLF